MLKHESPDNLKIRINKYLSECNIGPRRQISQFLKNGQFSVNEKTAEVGQIIDTNTDVVKLAGKILKPVDNFLYIKLNKPKNVLSTVKDDRERGRTTVLDLVKIKERLFPVGRLDFESTGLILLTNDGELALKLTHPKYHLPKVYEVEVRKKIKDIQIKQLENGIRLDNTKTLPAKVKKLSDTIFEIILYQGMKRQIREMCRSVDLSVKKLHRVSIGPIKLGDLQPGKYSELTKQELELLINSFKY